MLSWTDGLGLVLVVVGRSAAKTEQEVFFFFFFGPRLHRPVDVASLG